MTDPVVENLILDLLEWLGKQDRTYEDTMEAWRTSCPKLPVWEDATERGESHRGQSTINRHNAQYQRSKRVIAWLSTVELESTVPHESVSEIKSQSLQPTAPKPWESRAKLV